jgi:hypothetical protein
MKLRTLAPVLAALALLVSACVPLANFARDVVDTSDGATLTYLARTPDHPPGLTFTAGDEPALGAILIARGEQLEVLATPAGVTCTAEPTLVDCRLGDVETSTYVYMTGLDVVASVTYRRADATTVYQAFAR